MILRTSSMALAAQAALEDQVILKPITETITLVDDIIPEDMVKKVMLHLDLFIHLLF